MRQLTKRLLPTSLVVALLSAVLLICIHAADTAIQWEVSSATCDAGKTVEVAINIKNNPGIKAAQCTVSFDEQVLELKEIKQGNMGGMFTQKVATKNIVWVSSDKVEGDKTLATLTFQVLSTAHSNDTAVTVINTKAGETSSSPMENKVTDGAVTVTNGAPHTWNDGTVTQQADCEEAGVKTFTCTGCSATKTEPIAKLGHRTELRNKKDATCTEKGYTGDEVCTRCSKTIKAGTETAMAAHSYDSGTETQAPTCTADGVKTYTCSVCSGTKTEPIAKLGHDPELRNAAAATCTAEGYTGDQICKRAGCGATVEQGTAIAKLDHTFDDGVVTQEPSCTAEGIKTYTCTMCRTETKTESIAKVAHKTEIQGALAPTCEDKGATGAEVCTVCQQTIKESKEIAALGHKVESPDYKAPTCTEDGQTGIGTCTVCHKTFGTNEVIPATGHTEQDVDAVAATCTKDGTTAGVKCASCGIWLTEPTVVPATGHTEQAVDAVEATCTKAGATAGVKCATCGEWLTEPKVIAAKGHSWDDGIVTKAPTQTADGVKTFTCKVCKATRTEGIKKLSCDGGKDCISHGYSDVNQKEWYHQDVDYVIENGLMVGDPDGAFRPESTLTRAQFAQILYNRAGKPKVTGKSTYSDVANDAWYAPAIIWATQQKIVEGRGNGIFDPDGPVSRQEIAAMFWREAGKPSSSNALKNFTDAADTADFAKTAIKWAVDVEILRGNGNDTLTPKNSARRCEAAAMVRRYLEG